MLLKLLEDFVIVFLTLNEFEELYAIHCLERRGVRAGLLAV